MLNCGEKYNDCKKIYSFIGHFFSRAVINKLNKQPYEVLQCDIHAIDYTETIRINCPARRNNVCSTTATAALHHHMSLTCYIKINCTPATLAPAHTPCLFPIDLHTVRQHLVIVHSLLLHILSGTLFQMMSGVPHHCHHLSLV